MSKIDRRRVLATALGVSAAFVSVAEAQGPDTPNIALVKSLYAAFGKGDIKTIIAGCAPDIDWHSGGSAEDYPGFGPRKGHKAVEEFFKMFSSGE